MWEKEKKHADILPTQMPKKKKLVAWMVSKCETYSKRENYVKELQKYIEVDIYGHCGPLKCAKHDNACLDMLENDYKFYLSFENTICDGYVTEKLFKILSLNLVPVTFGGGPYSEIAPPNSYVNALSYESPKQLAEYLKFLDKNDEKYIEYFKWKKNYFVWTGRGPVICDACRKLHLLEEQSKIYPDIPGWFVETAQCKRWPIEDKTYVPKK